jgi:hypothetical protein
MMRLGKFLDHYAMSNEINTIQETMSFRLRKAILVLLVNFHASVARLIGSSFRIDPFSLERKVKCTKMLWASTQLVGFLILSVPFIVHFAHLSVTVDFHETPSTVGTPSVLILL